MQPPVERTEVFIESKVCITDYGYQETLHTFDKSARKLGVTRSTCLSFTSHYTLRSTAPSRRTGRSNPSTPTAKCAPSESATSTAEMTRLLESGIEVVPSVHQIEIHPFFSAEGPARVARNARHPQPSMVPDRWYHLLLGMRRFYWRRDGGSTLDDRALGAIARAYDKTPAQVMLRWHVQNGRSAIPKSVRPDRITEILDVFEFELSIDELAQIDYSIEASGADRHGKRFRWNRTDTSPFPKTEHLAHPTSTELRPP